MKTSMPSPGRILHDIKIAVVIGVLTELFLAWRAFEIGSELVGRHRWLEISQMPGAQISEQLFRHTGLLQALSFAIVFQSTVFSIVVLGVLYAYRLIRGKTALS